MSSFDDIRLDFQKSISSGFEKSSVELLKKRYESAKVSDVDRHAAVDQAFRDYLIQLLCKASPVSILEQYVTYCIQACRLDMCTATMPVVILGDIFDALTLDQCENLFAFVENGVTIWKEELFFSACKNNLLRMCNDLLRRLSRSQNTVFCGRILLFLAKFFPFSERSGLNIVSEFNLDNLTEFGGDGGTDLKDLIDDDDVEDESKTENKFKIDYNLYCKFWALQDFFRNPNQCYNKVHWKTFSSHASSVLLAFTSFKLDDLQGKNKKNYQHAPTDSRDCAEQNPHYFAKFLTNQKLLELQLSDSNFRRYVLVQFLIVFQYLNSPVKFKSENHELKPDQAEWVKETTEMIYKLLAETPPDGASFVQAVKHILKREEHWNSWKNEGCPVFQKPSHSQIAEESVNEEGGEKKKQIARPRRPKRKLGDLMRDASANKKFILGNPELTKLWNLCPNNLEACKSKERDFLPTLEAYFEEAIEQSDPASPIEDVYKRIFDTNFGWRALRLLARRSPHFFTHSNNPINKLSEYLDTMIKKVAKDRPSSQTNADEMRGEVLETEVQPLIKEEEDENDMLKGEVKDDEVEEETNTDRMPPQKPTSVQLEAVANLLGENWKKLAVKLDFRSEIEFFESQHSTDAERAKHFLVVWAEEDDDASPEFLAYILEGLDLKSAAKVLKT